jgi:CheY-like chemotaxis protein
MSQKQQVLVVNDDPAVRSVAAEVIDEANMQIEEANNAEDALAFLRDHAPDVRLVFTNFDLPGRLDGIDLARVASLRWPWIKVLVTSGEARIQDIPASAVLLPRACDPSDIRAHLDWEQTRVRATR